LIEVTGFDIRRCNQNLMFAMLFWQILYLVVGSTYLSSHDPGERYECMWSSHIIWLLQGMANQYERKYPVSMYFGDRPQTKHPKRRADGCMYMLDIHTSCRYQYRQLNISRVETRLRTASLANDEPHAVVRGYLHVCTCMNLPG
jgi:hypothetical protein